MRRQSMSRVTGGVHYCTPDWNMSTSSVQYSTVPGNSGSTTHERATSKPKDLRMQGKGASTNLDADTRGSICGVEISSEAE